MAHVSYNTPYIGRFAPSPSGPLHMGSLVCAVASYLDAKHHQGTWLVRIEDIDPPREQEGAAQSILDTLLHHGLQWDGEVRFQNTQSKAYDETLKRLQSMQLTYRCNCTRKRLNQISKHYDNHCRNQQIDNNTPAAIRLNIDAASQYTARTVKIQDLIQPPATETLSEEGDFVIHRKDGLYAYQLAVVVDDIDQNISHIIRGNDLFDCTGKQIFLTKLLNGQNIQYGHIPVLNDASGNKLSKQNHAPAVEKHAASKNIFTALTLLQLSPPQSLQHRAPHELIQWGIEHWQTNQLRNIQQLPYAL